MLEAVSRSSTHKLLSSESLCWLSDERHAVEENEGEMVANVDVHCGTKNVVHKLLFVWFSKQRSVSVFAIRQFRPKVEAAAM